MSAGGAVMTKLNNRNTGIELLRIVSMLFIVASHCSFHAGGNNWNMMKETIHANTIVSIIFGSWGQLGVLCFIIISSWFLVDKDGINKFKIVCILLQTWSICVIITVSFMIFSRNTIPPHIVIEEFFTPIYNQYWFITAYIVFYLTVPFLQIFSKSLSDELLKKLVVILVILVPTYNVIIGNLVGDIADFYVVFFVIAYLKRKKNNWFERNAVIGFILTFSVNIGMIIVGNIVINNYGITKLQTYWVSLFTKRHLLMYLCAIFLFYVFLNHVEIKKGRLIRKISETTLGIYIIHENFLFQGLVTDTGIEQSVLWDKWLRVGEYYKGSQIFVLYYIGAVVVVFLCACVLEYIRIALIDDVWLKKNSMINRLCSKNNK